VTTSIHVEDLGIEFLFDRHRRVVTPALARLHRRGPKTWGLRYVSFSLGPGEGLALIGASGSGKSTLLRTIAHVLEPDEGLVRICGRVASLLSIDAGLLSVLTGRDNAALISVLAGLSPREARSALDDVQERSHLGAQFNRSVASYSQGMRARLSLAVGYQVEPEILLLDEVHEALDHEFRAILEERAREILDRGGIVIAAGHDHTMLERLCSRGLWLSAGSVFADGPFREVQQAYLAAASNLGSK
jgi:ABC-type polysaccharide/polyol phosphate transport system ATPase subunit